MQSNVKQPLLSSARVRRIIARVDNYTIDGLVYLRPIPQGGVIECSREEVSSWGGILAPDIIRHSSDYHLASLLIQEWKAMRNPPIADDAFARIMPWFAAADEHIMRDSAARKNLAEIIASNFAGEDHPLKDEILRVMEARPPRNSMLRYLSAKSIGPTTNSTARLSSQPSTQGSCNGTEIPGTSMLTQAEIDANDLREINALLASKIKSPRRDMFIPRALESWVPSTENTELRIMRKLQPWSGETLAARLSEVGALMKVCQEEIKWSNHVLYHAAGFSVEEAAPLKRGVFINGEATPNNFRKWHEFFRHELAKQPKESAGAIAITETLPKLAELFQQTYYAMNFQQFGTVRLTARDKAKARETMLAIRTA